MVKRHKTLFQNPGNISDSPTINSPLIIQEFQRSIIIEIIIIVSLPKRSIFATDRKQCRATEGSFREGRLKE